jgi:hypothetical protein
VPILDVRGAGTGAPISSGCGRDDDKILLGYLEHVSCIKFISKSIVSALFSFAGLMF